MKKQNPTHTNPKMKWSDWHAGFNFHRFKTWVNKTWEKLLNADVVFEDDD